MKISSPRPEGFITIAAAKAEKPQHEEMCVPGETLTVDGTAPEMGDTVEFTVRGEVKRAEGGKLYIAPSEINGQPMPEMSAAEQPIDEEERVRQMAMEADGE